MDTSTERYEQIAREIESSDSPVGIDAKKTHILILQMLQDIQQRLDRIERRLDLEEDNQS